MKEENKKSLSAKTPILIAALILLIGIIDVAATTRFFRSTYGGILSFLVGKEPYISAIIAGIVWIVLAVGAFLLVKAIISKKPKKFIAIGGAALIVILAAIIIVPSLGGNKAPTRDEVKSWFNTEFVSQSDLEFQAFGNAVSGNNKLKVLGVWYTIDIPYNDCKAVGESHFEAMFNAAVAIRSNVRVGFLNEFEYDNIVVSIILQSSDKKPLAIITTDTENCGVEHLNPLWGIKD